MYAFEVRKDVLEDLLDAYEEVIKLWELSGNAGSSRESGALDNDSSKLILIAILEVCL